MFDRELSEDNPGIEERERVTDNVEGVADDVCYERPD